MDRSGREGRVRSHPASARKRTNAAGPSFNRDALLEERLRELVGPFVPGFDRGRVRLDADLGLVAQILAPVELLERGDGDRPGRALVAPEALEEQRNARAV